MARPGHIARLLALVALCLQVFVPAISVISLLPPAGQTVFGGLFDPDLICHAADPDQQPRPESPAKPAPHRLDHAACCPWHGNASLSVPVPAIVEQIALAYAAASFPTPTGIIVAAHRPGDVRARSPPAEA